MSSSGDEYTRWLGAICAEEAPLLIAMDGTTERAVTTTGGVGGHMVMVAVELLLRESDMEPRERRCVVKIEGQRERLNMRLLQPHAWRSCYRVTGRARSAKCRVRESKQCECGPCARMHTVCRLSGRVERVVVVDGPRPAVRRPRGVSSIRVLVADGGWRHRPFLPRAMGVT